MNMRSLVRLLIASLTLILFVACRTGVIEPAGTPAAATPAETEILASPAYPAEEAAMPTDTAEATAVPAYPAGEATVAPYPAPETETEGLRPPDALLCANLRNQVAEALDVETTLQEVPFEDYVNNETGQGCQVQAMVPAEAVASPAEIMNTLITTFAGEGWMEDQSYAADGPTGTATALRNSDGSVLCLLNVSWDQSGGPYVVTFNCAQK